MAFRKPRFVWIVKCTLAMITFIWIHFAYSFNNLHPFWIKFKNLHFTCKQKHCKQKSLLPTGSCRKKLPYHVINQIAGNKKKYRFGLQKKLKKDINAFFICLFWARTSFTHVAYISINIVSWQKKTHDKTHTETTLQFLFWCLNFNSFFVFKKRE